MRPPGGVDGGNAWKPIWEIHIRVGVSSHGKKSAPTKGIANFARVKGIKGCSAKAAATWYDFNKKVGERDHSNSLQNIRKLGCSSQRIDRPFQIGLLWRHNSKGYAINLLQTEGQVHLRKRGACLVFLVEGLQAWFLTHVHGETHGASTCQPLRSHCSNPIWCPESQPPPVANPDSWAVTVLPGGNVERTVDSRKEITAISSFLTLCGVVLFDVFCNKWRRNTKANPDHKGYLVGPSYMYNSHYFVF